MLQPKKSKYRKMFRGKNRGMATKGTKIVFGEYGLRAMTSGMISARQIEAARKKITFATKRTGKYWVRIFPDKPVSKKAVGVKMGSGKGDIDRYVAVVKRGTIMFELGGVPEELAQEALKKAGHKLSVLTKIIAK
jgi:large subunit ribosomal protein L16